MKKTTNSVLSVFNLSPRRIGGTEIYARELSEQLAAKGWESILCFSAAPTSKVQQFFDPSKPTIEAIAGMHDSAWTTIQNLRPLLKKHRPRILHLHYTSLLSPAPWLGRFSSVERAFYTDHTSRPENALPRPAALWKRLVARCASPWDGIFCGSQYGQSYLRIRGYLGEKKIHTVYNATMPVDDPNLAESGSAFRRRHGIPTEAILIVQVGQLAEYKGISDLLQAFAKVRAEIDTAHLALVGDGPMAAEIPQLLKELDLEKHVTLTGLVDDPISSGVYAAADICCQVSRWEELFGFSIAEAMACQRPVVGTAVGGIPEVITDGVTGYLSPRRDVDQIAKQIITLASDADLRKKMGIAGREKMIEKFNVKKNVAQMIDLYGIVE